MKTFKYTPVGGVCSQSIEIKYDNDIISSLKVIGGCHGNLQGIASLLSGMKIDEAIKKLEGIKCGYKNTSCPDQIAVALKKIKNSK